MVGLEKRGRRVLVVDDDPFVGLVTARLLQQQGLLARSTQSPAEAVGLALEGQADLILADLEMPGLSGTELCAVLKSSPYTREIPVVLFSGHAAEDREALALEAGAAAYLEKPFLAENLFRRVDAALAAPLLRQKRE